MSHTYRFQVLQALGQLMHDLLDNVMRFIFGKVFFYVLERALFADFINEKNLVLFTDDIVDEINDSRIRQGLENAHGADEALFFTVLGEVILGVFLHGELNI